MAKKVTSQQVASQASKILKDDRYSNASKSVAVVRYRKEKRKRDKPLFF